MIKTNMRTKKNTSSPKIITATLVALALVIIVPGIIYATSGSLFGWDPLKSEVKTDSSNNNPASQDQLDSGSSIKEQSTKNGGTSGSDQPSQPQTQQDGKKLVETDIISINPIESIVRVSAMISILDQSGSCTLTITSQDNSIVHSQTVGVQAQSNTSVCKGFDVPAATLVNGQKYVFKVSYSNGEYYGNAEKSYVKS